MAGDAWRYSGRRQQRVPVADPSGIGAVCEADVALADAALESVVPSSGSAPLATLHGE